jgi:E3 ubiquitin-protein ligase ZNF598
MVEVHGSDMSARDMKDARRIQADFEFEEVGVGGRRGRRDRGDREREREPPPHAGPSRANAAGARRREAFGGNLTSETPAALDDDSNRIASRRQSPSPDMDPAVAE